jgi:hypothetical protein
MSRNANLALICVAVLTASCGKTGDEAKGGPGERQPMALEPSPPMSSSDIDAIVKEQGAGAATTPATNGNTSGEQRN